MLRLLFVSVVGCGALVIGGGCKHKCCRSDAITAPRPFLPGGPNTIPPPGVPISPAPSVLPPSSNRLPPPDLGRPAPKILLPDPVPGGASRSGYKAPAAAPLLGAPVTTPEPPKADATAGLPGFVKVQEGAASGGKPTLDGFTSLKQSGYRTVVFLHEPGADVSAVREVVEARDLAFTAIGTTPDSLTASSAAFEKVIADRTAGPVYVIDESGERAGALWYLHFRGVDQESGEVAKIRARTLGLTDESPFWPGIDRQLGVK